MSDTIMADIPEKEPKRKVLPRKVRYNGRTPREILFLDDKDAWITKQMSAKWSRNQVVDQCIGIAMGKVQAATDQEDALAASLTAMRKDIDALAHQVDARLKYPAPNTIQPQTFDQHRALVQEAVQSLKGTRS